MSVIFDQDHPLAIGTPCSNCGHGCESHMPEMQKDGSFIYGPCQEPGCLYNAMGCQEFSLEDVRGTDLDSGATNA